DRVVDHMQGDAPGADRRLPASHQNPQGFDHAVPASRRHGPLACKGGIGRVLSVEIVVLSSPTSILLVGGRDLENRDLCLLHKAQEPCAVAASRLYSDALQLTKGAHPGEHLAIALPGCGEGSCSEDPILLIDNRRDVKILVGVDAAGGVSLSPFDDRHSLASRLPCPNWLHRDR